MHSLVPPEGSGVPQKIQTAERWRRLGERLHAISPQLFEQVFAMLVLGLPDESAENITESYFLT